MCVPDFMATRPIDSKSHANLMVVVEEKVAYVIRIYRLGTVNVPNFEPLHYIDVEIFHRISTNFDLLVELEEKSGNHQNH